MPSTRNSTSSLPPREGRLQYGYPVATQGGEEMKRDKNYYIRKAFDLCVAEATGSPINNPSDLYEVLRPWAASDQENFLVVFLDSAQRVKSVERITMGLLNRTLL